MRRANPETVVVLARDGVELATWPVTWRGRPDLALVEQLARWQLAARRLGCSIWLREACGELAGLLDLVGLADVLPGGLGRQVAGQAEGGEQFGVQEVVVPDDPVA